MTIRLASLVEVEKIWRKKIDLIFLSKEDFLKLHVSLLVSDVCVKVIIIVEKAMYKNKKAKISVL